ncbi:unnamed protein product [Urochloa decumbens]|uniref:Uncharacterized protein n=1 Tax=Urochloa decumbens TaxID=240449 RepID=A0ABC8XH00_9POAL
MGKLGNASDYESLRDARISETKIRLEMLGLRRAKEELNAMVAAAAPARRPWAHKQYATGPPRSRCSGLSEMPVGTRFFWCCLVGLLGKAKAVAVGEDEEEVEEEGEHNAPAVVEEKMGPEPKDSDGEGMEAVYDPVHGETAISAEDILLLDP